MNITVPTHEIISWLVTVVAVTLYLMERRKNVTAPCYLNQDIPTAVDEFTISKNKEL